MAANSVALAATLRTEAETFVVAHALAHFEERCATIPADDNYFTALWELHCDSMFQPWLERVGKPMYSNHSLPGVDCDDHPPV